MPSDTDAAFLAHLKESFAGDLPAWLETELSHAPQPIGIETAAACQQAANGDVILRNFAERLAPRMPKAARCAHRVLAHELLLAAAVPAAATSDCAMCALGCGGPCALRCQTEIGEDTLALLRQAVRYIAVTYQFSRAGEIAAENIVWVKRRSLDRLPLERSDK